MATPLRLPAFALRGIEALAERMLAPPGTSAVDFSQPAGAQALVPPTSVSWQVFKNPVTLFIGGVTAVLLELAEPRVRHGVWDHSNFRTDPLLRLQRTGLAAMVTVYGPAELARPMIAGITRRHARVTGVTPDGLPYSAADPELLDWVEATAAFGFLAAYTAYAEPLEAAARDRYFAEGTLAGSLYGATGAPASEAEWRAQLARARPQLGPSDTLAEFLAIMRRVAAMPRIARPLQPMMIKAAVAILPPGLADRLRLGPEWRLRGWEAALVRTMAGAANRLVIRAWPAVQACRRLGLPDDHLYR